MDWAFKAALTASVVASVMMAARLIGRPAAGMLAGLPVITVPSLLWLAQEQGATFAAASAIGSLAACAAAPAFAWAFERTAQRHGAWWSLAAGAATLTASALVLKPLGGQPVATLLVVAMVCALVFRAVAARGARSGWVRQLRGEPWLSAALAGAVSATVSLLAIRVGPFWSGMLSTLPLISACALVHLRRAGGAGDVTRFVTGYVPGVFAKALFVFAFALTVPTWGPMPAAALALAFSTVGALLLTARRPARWPAPWGGSGPAS